MATVTYVGKLGNFSLAFGVNGGAEIFRTSEATIGQQWSVPGLAQDLVFYMTVFTTGETYLSNNPDRVRITVITGGLRYAWEDQVALGDQDYNDLIVDIVDFEEPVVAQITGSLKDVRRTFNP